MHQTTLSHLLCQIGSILKAVVQIWHYDTKIGVMQIFWAPAVNFVVPVAANVSQ